MNGDTRWLHCSMCDVQGTLCFILQPVNCSPNYTTFKHSTINSTAVLLINPDSFHAGCRSLPVFAWPYTAEHWFPKMQHSFFFRSVATGWRCSHIVTDVMMHFMIHTFGLFLWGKIQMRVKLKEKPTYITSVLVLCDVGPLQTDITLLGIDWWGWRALSNTSPLGCQLGLDLVIVKAKTYY